MGRRTDQLEQTRFDETASRKTLIYWQPFAGTHQNGAELVAANLDDTGGS